MTGVVVCDNSDKQRVIGEEWRMTCCGGYPHSVGCLAMPNEHKFIAIPVNKQ